MRLSLLVLLVVAATASRAQTVVTLDGPATLRLGEPLVLRLRATLASPGAWPSIALPGMTGAEAVTVRRDAPDGPVVDLESPAILCGIGASGLLTGTEWPVGTASEGELIVHDARLTEPGRYVVQVTYQDHATAGRCIVYGDTVAHTVEVVLPDEAAERAASEALAHAVRAATDPRWMSDTEPRWLAFREVLALAGDAPIGDVAAAGAAIHAPDRWRPDDEPPDSADAAVTEAVVALADRYLARHPAGPLAPAVARARLTALDPDLARTVDVRGVCEGRVFVVSATTALPLRAVAVGLDEAIDIPAMPGDLYGVQIAFSRPVQAVHLTVGGETVTVAPPNASTCRDAEFGAPPTRLGPR